MSDVESRIGEKSLLSRRKVIGTAIWAAPAITLATAAPALAASGDVISFGAATASWSGLLGIIAPTLNLSAPITLTTKHSSQATALSVVVVLGATPSQNLTANPPTGWTVLPTGGSKTTTYTFTKTANAPVGTVTFNPTFSAGLIVLSYPLPKGTPITFTASAGSTVTTPPPVGFTNTGQPGGATTVSTSASTSN